VSFSGSSVFRIIVANVRDLQAARNEFKDLSCASELYLQLGLFAVEVPGTVNFDSVADLLSKGEGAGR
jgi:hypothetical protein